MDYVKSNPIKPNTMYCIKNIELLDIFQVAAVTPQVILANPEANAEAIIETLGNERLRKASFVVFPELCITGYTVGDLFFQHELQQRALQALRRIISATAIRGTNCLFAVGLPIQFKGRLYNCAAVVAPGGRLLGFVPKSNIPNYQEFYEKRWFSSGNGITGEFVDFFGVAVPFGTDLIFNFRGVKVGVEICEDLWVPEPPSSRLCRQGAELILNLSATDEVLGKYPYLINLITSQSGRCRCAYAYASAGQGESSTDLVFSGNDIIAVDGIIKNATKRFDKAPKMAVGWMDAEKIRGDRAKFSSFFQEAEQLPTVREIKPEYYKTPETLTRTGECRVNPRPFVPSDAKRLDANCQEIMFIQSSGLEQRLRATGCRTLVIGVSGGLDSTLALLVAHLAFIRLGLPLKGIHGVTMPGTATSSRTYRNALMLMKQLGITHHEIPVKEAVELHFRDIDHDPDNHDTTYENSQARERTQILMDLANKLGGMVLGTGDLSELALGWCTYNGDHMSMYNVNAGVPKTLVKHLVNWRAKTASNAALREVLLDVVDTPISPELVPSENGEEISQKTEDLVGPYELHDFFLYHTLRNGFSPKKIFAMASLAFGGVYDKTTIKKWLVVFYRRFFSQQFKRSCMPDGPKVGSVCLSPRGDWRMPSDASAKIWIEEAEKL